MSQIDGVKRPILIATGDVEVGESGRARKRDSVFLARPSCGIGVPGLTNVGCKRRSVKSAMALASATEKTKVGAMNAYYAINWTIVTDGISLDPRKGRD
jgi:hypothetical protein